MTPTDRRCSRPSCIRPAHGTSDLCAVHSRGRQRGHPSVTKALSRQEWAAAFEAAQDWLRDHPASEEVLNKLDNALRPETAPQPLRAELQWWREPANYYKTSLGKVRRDNSMTGVLATLLGVTLFGVEREHSFPGESLEVARAVAVLRMRKRPKAGAKTTKEIGTTVRKLLWRRLNIAVGRYLQEEVQKMIAARYAAEGEKHAVEVPPFSDTSYWIMTKTPEMQLYESAGTTYEVFTGRDLIGYRERTEADGDLEFVKLPPRRVQRLPEPVEMQPYRFGDNDGRSVFDARQTNRPARRHGPDSNGRWHNVVQGVRFHQIDGRGA